MSGQPRFCEHCGAPLLPQARFCENCGHPIGAAATPPQQIDDSAPTRQVPKAPPPARKTPIVPILIVALVLAAAAVAFMALRKPAKPAGEVLTAAVAPVATPVPAPALPTPVPPPTAAPDALTSAAATQAAAAQAAAAQAATAHAAAARPRPTPPIVATYQCRIGVKFDVEPEEAEVSVDGRPIGTVEDLDDGYTFEGAGSYYLRFEKAGYKTIWLKVVCRPEAEEDYYEIDRELEEVEEE